jgi:predicted transposase/invertase (TIGR01784 family)
VAFLRQLAQSVPLQPHKEALMNIAQFLEDRGRQEGMQQGRQQGLEAGIEKGRQEGEQKAAERIALAMIDCGLELPLVAELTGLSLQRLAQLKH